MLTNFPNGVTSFGLPVLPGAGLSLPVSAGRVFFVQGTIGIDATGRGTDPTIPFRTINYASTQCRDNKGDIIIVMAGHTEVVSAAGTITLAKIGVTILGLGNGTNRPLITFTTATSASVLVTAANVTIRNIVFDMASGAFDAVVAAITVTAANFTCDGCRCLMADATYQGVSFISLGAGANNATISNPDVVSTAAAGAAQAILVGAAISNVAIINPRIRGNFSVAALIANTGTNHVTDLAVDGGQVWQTNGTAKVIIDVTTGSTGLVANGRWRGTTWSTAADSVSSTSTGLKYFQNYGFDDATGAVSGVLVPAAGTIS